MDDKSKDEVVTAQPVSSAPAPAGAAAGGGGGDGGGNGIPEYLYWGLGFASAQLLIVTCYDCDNVNSNGGECENKLAYAVFAAMVSCVVILVHFVVKMVPQIAGMCACWNQFFEPFLAIGLWVLWLITLPILTMPDSESDADEVAPYQGLGTAWLMTWAAAALSTLMVAPAFGGWYQKLVGLMPFLSNLGPAKESSAEMLLGVLLLSFVVMWCCSDICAIRDKAKLDCDNEYAWGLVVSLFSIIYCLIMLLCGQCLDSLLSGAIVKWMSVVLAIWWWMGATIITVTNGPDDGMVFTVFGAGTPANGFFGTWLAFAFSSIMAGHHFGLVDIKGA